MVCLCVTDVLLTDAFWMILITALWGIFSTQCLMVKKGSVHEETFISEEQPTHISLAMNTVASDSVFWPQNSLSSFI